MQRFSVYVKLTGNPRDKTWDIIYADLTAAAAARLAEEIAEQGSFDRIEIAATTARR